eukprot:snap_masked-scaffold_15-processed-gene-3.7-mRNA-1 protein AED:1.00 eAED:1.00 QI:0/0/0/0/1/1/2/0/922
MELPQISQMSTHPRLEPLNDPKQENKEKFIIGEIKENESNPNFKFEDFVAAPTSIESFPKVFKLKKLSSRIRARESQSFFKKQISQDKVEVGKKLASNKILLAKLGLNELDAKKIDESNSAKISNMPAAERLQTIKELEKMFDANVLENLVRYTSEELSFFQKPTKKATEAGSVESKKENIIEEEKQLQNFIIKTRSHITSQRLVAFEALSFIFSERHLCLYTGRMHWLKSLKTNLSGEISLALASSNLQIVEKALRLLNSLISPCVQQVDMVNVALLMFQSKMKRNDFWDCLSSFELFEAQGSCLVYAKCLTQELIHDDTKIDVSLTMLYYSVFIENKGFKTLLERTDVSNCPLVLTEVLMILAVFGSICFDGFFLEVLELLLHRLCAVVNRIEGKELFLSINESERLPKSIAKYFQKILMSLQERIISGVKFQGLVALNFFLLNQKESSHKLVGSPMEKVVQEQKENESFHTDFDQRVELSKQYKPFSLEKFQNWSTMLEETENFVKRQFELPLKVDVIKQFDLLSEVLLPCISHFKSSFVYSVELCFQFPLSFLLLFKESAKLFILFTQHFPYLYSHLGQYKLDPALFYFCAIHGSHHFTGRELSILVRIWFEEEEFIPDNFTSTGTSPELPYFSKQLLLSGFCHDNILGLVTCWPIFYCLLRAVDDKNTNLMAKAFEFGSFEDLIIFTLYLCTSAGSTSSQLELSYSAVEKEIISRLGSVPFSSVVKNIMRTIGGKYASTLLKKKLKDLEKLALNFLTLSPRYRNLVSLVLVLLLDATWEEEVNGQVLDSFVAEGRERFFCFSSSDTVDTVVKKVLCETVPYTNKLCDKLVLSYIDLYSSGLCSSPNEFGLFTILEQVLEVNILKRTEQFHWIGEKRLMLIIQRVPRLTSSFKTLLEKYDKRSFVQKTLRRINSVVSQ